MAAFDTVSYKKGSKRVKSKSAHLYASGDMGEPTGPPKNLPNLNKKVPKTEAHDKGDMKKMGAC